MNVQQKLEELKRIYARSDDAMVADFEIMLTDIASSGDPGIIVPLLGFLEDEPPADEILFSIVHAIEAFGDDIYIEEILRGTEELMQRAPRWSRILFMRILNSEPTRTALGRAIRAQSAEIIDALRSILCDIRSRRPEFGIRIDYLLNLSTAP